VLLGYCGAQSVDAVKFGIPDGLGRPYRLALLLRLLLADPAIVGLIETPKSFRIHRAIRARR
jgi:hypothetical protein